MKRLGLSYDDTEIDDIYEMFDNSGAEELTFKKFIKIVPKECDERMLVLICNDIIDGVLVRLNKKHFVIFSEFNFSTGINFHDFRRKKKAIRRFHFRYTPF